MTFFFSEHENALNAQQQLNKTDHQSGSCVDEVGSRYLVGTLVAGVLPIANHVKTQYIPQMPRTSVPGRYFSEVYLYISS